jgi:tetratricopeptide (TPR) repeat protein
MTVASEQPDDKNVASQNTSEPKVRKLVPRSRRALIGTMLLLLGAAGVIGWWWSRQPEPPRLSLQQVDPEIAAAIQEAHADVLRNPGSSSTWGHLGAVLLINRVFLAEALECFAKAEQRDVDEPQYPFFRGKILAELGRRPEARVALERVLQLCDKRGELNPAPRLLLAEVLLTSEQFAEARTQFQEALNHDPHNPQASWGLGRLAFAGADWAACKRHLEACLLSPYVRKKAAAQLAALYRRLGDLDGAAHFAGVAARSPRDVDWVDSFTAEILYLSKRKEDRYSLVVWLEAAGKFPEATEALESLARDYPGDCLAHMMLGVLLPRYGQFREAETYLRHAYKLAPDKFQVNYQLSRVYLGSGEHHERHQPADAKAAQDLFRQAELCARQALAEKPDYGFAHLALGLSLSKLGRTADALDSFREAVRCLPENMESHLHLGLAFAAAGKNAEARKHLEEALHLAGSNEPRARAALEKLAK